MGRQANICNGCPMENVCTPQKKRFGCTIAQKKYVINKSQPFKNWPVAQK